MDYNVVIGFEEENRKYIKFRSMSRNQYGVNIKKLCVNYILKTTKIERNGDVWKIEMIASRKPKDEEFYWCGPGKAYAAGDGRWFRVPF